MSEWREFEFGEIAEIQTGPFGSQLVKDEYIDGGIPVITVENIKDFQIESFTYPSVTRDKSTELTRYFIQEGDVLFSRVGSVDLSALVKKEQDGWIISSRMLRARLNDFGNARFVAYFLQQSKVRRYINAIAVGATMPSINTSILKSIPIRLPQLETQIAIAEVLSSLDDKIHLLKRQNKTLEGMAEALFRQWFIEEAQEDWEDVEISDVFSIERGLSYKGAGLTSSDDPNGVPMFNLNSVLEFGGYKEEGIKFYNGAHKERHVVHPGDLLVANTEQGHDHRLIGFPCIVPTKFKKGILSHHLYKLTPKAELGGHFMHQLLKTFAVRGQVEGCTNGSTVNMLLIDLFGRVSFKRPPEKIHDAFDEQASALHQRKEKNWASIETLVKQRDTLLPKLMSGEFRVQMD